MSDVNGLFNSAVPNLASTCGADSTFHLPVGSPCIDEGTSVDAPTTDFEADNRPIGAGIDIGPDEAD